MNKNKYVLKYDKYQKKLDSFIDQSIQKKKLEDALIGMNMLNTLKYHWNQTYVDSKMEEQIQSVTEMASIFLAEKISALEKQRQDCILFYDSFGLDLRGLASIYLKALLGTGKRLIYVTVSAAKGNQSTINKILENQNVVVEYINKDCSYVDCIGQLLDIFIRYAPIIAFEYNQPWDMDGIITFQLLRNVVRYKINLTDHAYWSGVSSFDYCIEFRDYGAVISEQYRGIHKEKIIKLPYYPFIDKSVAYNGLPFEENGKKIVFSGGSLYKTIGEGNLYYRIVEEILNMDSSVVFIYAGSGDDSELRRLVLLYPSRVYHISERKDLFELMKHCYFYLSTYPMIGGLMSQYAAAAGKLPITLKHNDDGCGVLLNEEELGINYENSEALLEDVRRLLEDSDYKKEKEKLLQYSLISEQEFEEEIVRLTCSHCTKYHIRKINLDTQDFIRDYKYRFGDNELAAAASKRNKKVAFKFMGLYIRKIYIKLLRKR